MHLWKFSSFRFRSLFCFEVPACDANFQLLLRLTFVYEPFSRLLVYVLHTHALPAELSAQTTTTKNTSISWLYCLCIQTHLFVIHSNDNRSQVHNVVVVNKKHMVFGFIYLLCYALKFSLFPFHMHIFDFFLTIFLYSNQRFSNYFFCCDIVIVQTGILSLKIIYYRIESVERFLTGGNKHFNL